MAARNAIFKSFIRLYYVFRAFLQPTTLQGNICLLCFVATVSTMHDLHIQKRLKKTRPINSHHYIIVGAR